MPKAGKGLWVKGFGTDLNGLVGENEMLASRAKVQEELRSRQVVLHHLAGQENATAEARHGLDWPKWTRHRLEYTRHRLDGLDWTRLH